MIHASLRPFTDNYSQILAAAVGFANGRLSLDPDATPLSGLSLHAGIETIEGRLEIVALVGSMSSLSESQGEMLTDALRIQFGAPRLHIRFQRTGGPIQRFDMKGLD